MEVHHAQATGTIHLTSLKVSSRSNRYVKRLTLATSRSAHIVINIRVRENSRSLERTVWGKTATVLESRSVSRYQRFTCQQLYQVLQTADNYTANMIRALQQVLCMLVPTRHELEHPALWWTRGELLFMRCCYFMWRQQHIVHDSVDLLE